MKYHKLYIIVTIIGVSPIFAQPVNDECTGAIPIFGEGVFPFDSTAATTGGRSDCGGIPNDVWFCWTAPQSGPLPRFRNVTVDTCGRTMVDTKISWYWFCECLGQVQSCNDDACGYQSRSTFEIVEGESYLIRIGTHPGATDETSGGVGTFVISFDEFLGESCTVTDEACQPPDRWDALLSDGLTASVADSFTPASTGFLNSVCWWGAYLDGVEECFIGAEDFFEVRYYLDVDGLPGPLIAGPFRQENLGLSLETRKRTTHMLMETSAEFEYRATHEPIPLLGGQTYWMEIVNDVPGDCDWYWEVGRGKDRRAVQDGPSSGAIDGYDATDVHRKDMASCANIALGEIPLTVTAPANDECDLAQPVADGDVVRFDTSAATTSHVPTDSTFDCLINQTCFPLGDQVVHADVWYELAPSCPAQVTVETCESLFDTKLAVYEADECGEIGVGDLIAVNDDDCAPAGWPVPQPLEDSGQSVEGETASRDTGDCFVPHDYPGCDTEVCESIVCLMFPWCCGQVWYNECARLAIHSCRDSIGDGLQSRVEFRAEAGQTYRIRVGGYRGDAGPGTLALELGPPMPTVATMGSDAVALLDCLTGPAAPISGDGCCPLQDFNGDSHVDLLDFATFSRMSVLP
jgi:hypothetical protein